MVDRRSKAGVANELGDRIGARVVCVCVVDVVLLVKGISSGGSGPVLSSSLDERWLWPSCLVLIVVPA